MMKPSAHLRLFALLVAFTSPLASVRAQDLVPAGPDPTPIADAPGRPGPEGDWEFQIGAVSLYGPAFLGSRDYQLMAVPNVEVRFKDRFFISVIDGAGFDLIKTANFRAGPIVKYQFARQQNDDNLFRIGGGRTHALHGLGNVGAAAEAGGYIRFELGDIAAKAQVRKGFGGHHGIVADLGMEYASPLLGMSIDNQPIMYSIGASATIVDNKYNQAYFGIDAARSARSGLARYDARGGLLSYGVSATVVVPVAGNLGAVVLARFDQLSGDASKSPLVREHGSRSQGMVGLGLMYRFGL